MLPVFLLGIENIIHKNTKDDGDKNMKRQTKNPIFAAGFKRQVHFVYPKPSAGARTRGGVLVMIQF